MGSVCASAAATAWARCNTVDADGYDGDGRGHPIPQDQPERRANLPKAIGPIRLDLAVFDSLGSGDDLREPLSLNRCSDDVQYFLPSRSAPVSQAIGVPSGVSALVRSESYLKHIWLHVIAIPFRSTISPWRDRNASFHFLQRKRPRLRALSLLLT
jgi:hypothetical protein